MAFQFTHSLNNSYEEHNRYPASDSDNEFRVRIPRDVGEIFRLDSSRDEIHFMNKSGSQGSLGLSYNNPLEGGRRFSNNSEQFRTSSCIPSSEDPNTISYNKYQDSQDATYFHQEPNYYSGQHYDNADFGDGECSPSRYGDGGNIQQEYQGNDADQGWQENNFRDNCHSDHEENMMDEETETRASEYYSPSVRTNDFDDRTTIISGYDDRWQGNPRDQYRDFSEEEDEEEEESYRTKQEADTFEMVNEHCPREEYRKYLRVTMQRNSVKLRDIIERIMQGKLPKESECQGLTDFEREIIRCIGEKKWKGMGSKSSKRREEKQKLFFKSALKYIESRFNNQMTQHHNITRKKEVDPTLFYITYFGDAAAAMGLEISTFFPPCQKRKFRNGGANCTRNTLKSFNLKYIELILSSERFMRETIEYLEYGFIQTYVKSRCQKIDKVLEHVMVVADQATRANNGLLEEGSFHTFLDMAQRKISDVILNNSKSKLPWSDAELEEAKEFARKTIEKVNHDRKERR